MGLTIGPMPEGRAAPPAPRLSERAIARIGIALTGVFLALSLLVGLLPLGGLHGWVAIHLSLAGAATVAIGTFMPHFGVTLAGTRPEPWPVRLAGVLALALGMATVALGRPIGASVAAWGGMLVLAGLLLTAWGTFAPMRSGLARRHPVAQLAYAVALADLALGASLAVAFLFGWPPVADSWVNLKPAHVWLNLFGFVAMTVAGTLIYLYPTMLGARIRPQPAIAVAVIGLLAGAPLVAAGSTLSLRPMEVFGATCALAGAVGLLWYGVDTWRRRGRWSTDLAWHDLAARHGLAAMAWFVAVVLALLAGILRDGVAVPGWSLGPLAAPLIAGWVGQVLVAAWSYLLPAIGPGGMAAKAWQRRLLGRWGTQRVIAWNVGLLLLWPALALSAWPMVVAGVLLFAPAALASLALLARALTIRG